MIRFKEEFADIVNVDKISAFCFGAKDEITIDGLIQAGSGSKFSTLCGIKFCSKVNPTYRNGEFKIVFCVKNRSKIFRQTSQNPSQWFAFLQVGKNHVEVLDKRNCKLAFDFDVDKFLDSDLFQKFSEKFAGIVENGVRSAKDLVKGFDGLNGLIPGTEHTYESLPGCIKAIEDSIPLITNQRFNDKHYTLKMSFENPNLKYGKKQFDPEKFREFLRRNQAETRSIR